VAVEEILADVPRPTTGGGTWGGRSPRSTGRSVSLPSTEALEAGCGRRLRTGADCFGRNGGSARVRCFALCSEPLRFAPIRDERRRAYAFRAPIALNRLIPGVIS
jgi:hypothetical protein